MAEIWWVLFAIPVSVTVPVAAAALFFWLQDE